MKKIKIFLILTICLTSMIHFLGCGSNSSNPSSPIIPTIASNFAVGQGNGTNEVRFNQASTGLNSLSLQVRISGAPEGFATTATVKTVAGEVKTLTKANIPFDGLVLAVNEIDLFGVADFSTLTFADPIPAGAKVEIYNADVAMAMNPALRGQLNSNYTYRMDYNGSGMVNSHDIILYMAWYQLHPNNTANILSHARDIWAGTQGPIVALPNPMTDDLNDDGVVNSHDGALLIAWYQVGRDATKMVARAKELDPNVNGPVVRYPMDPITWFEVNFGQDIANLNTYNLQIRIRQVPTDFDTYTMLDCETAQSATATPVVWKKSPSITIPDGVVLVADTIDLMTVSTFRKIYFPNDIPNGAIVEIYNKDTDTVVASAYMRLLTDLTLSPPIVAVQINQTFDIGTVEVIASYSNGTALSPENVIWTLISGSGTLASQTYTAPGAYGETIMTCAYQEGDIAKVATLTIKNIEPPPTLEATFGSYGEGDGQFVGPLGIAIDASDRLWVSDRIKITCLNNQDGSFVKKIVGLASDPGKISYSGEIAVDNAGNILLTQDHKVMIFAQNGDFLEQWGEFGSNLRSTANPYRFFHPKGVAVASNGRLLVCDYSNGRINTFDANGASGIIWGASLSNLPTVGNPYSVAIDSSGNIYVSSITGIVAIKKFACNGNFVKDFTLNGNLPGNGNYITGLSIDQNNHLWAVDYRNARIMKFDLEGNLITFWGYYGSSTTHVWGIDVDSQGKIYTTHIYNHCVRRWGYAP